MDPRTQEEVRDAMLFWIDSEFMPEMRKAAKDWVTQDLMRELEKAKRIQQDEGHGGDLQGQGQASASASETWACAQAAQDAPAAACPRQQEGDPEAQGHFARKVARSMDAKH